MNSIIGQKENYLIENLSKKSVNISTDTKVSELNSSLERVQVRSAIGANHGNNCDSGETKCRK